MNKILITTGFALLLFASVAGAQNYSFNTDLTLGSSGPDVVNLQSWLISNGYSIPAVISGAVAKGYFGTQTQSALSAYQRSIGLPAYGYFGSLTRARLNGNGGVIDNRGMSLRIMSPNGGETWQRGTVHSITWTGAQELSNQTVDIRLQFQVPACAEPTNAIRCMIAVRAPLTIASGINLGSGSFTWNVGIVNESPIEANTNYVPDGQYKIQICPTNGSQCDVSDNYFTITSSQSNVQPVINGVDAPTTLSVNQTGTWSIRATDPMNGTLSYSVLWGDEPGYAVTGGTIASPQMSQTTTLQHSYSNAGIYTVTVTVRNNSGGMVQTSSSVTVISTNQAGSLMITSPNGGEIWQRGTTQTITWTSPYYIRATYADLKLVPTNQCTGTYCTAIYQMPIAIASNISINQNSFTWTIPNTIPDGQYTVQICESGTNNCDSSNGYVTISINTNSNTPDIDIVSPNGGETWVIGSPQIVSFNITGDPSRIYGDFVAAYLVNSNNPNQLISLGSFSQGITVGLKTVTVTVPNFASSPVFYSSPGSYRLLLNLYSGNQQLAYDYSDNYFTVTSQLYPVYNCPAGYSCVPQNTTNLLRVCPNEQINNQMPSILPNAGMSVLPSTYYVLNGQRYEISQFDQAWVNANCNVPVQTVY